MSQVTTVSLVHKDYVNHSKENSAFAFEEDVPESEIGHFINEVTDKNSYANGSGEFQYDVFDVAQLRALYNNNSFDGVQLNKFCFICVNKFLLQVLLKELEEFAFKGIPDVRGCKVQDAQILEEIVSYFSKHFGAFGINAKEPIQS